MRAVRENTKLRTESAFDATGGNSCKALLVIDPYSSREGLARATVRKESGSLIITLKRTRDRDRLGAKFNGQS
jgi:hypothetical protein